MKGIFRVKPPKPRYEKTWDISPVLEKVAAWFPLEDLSFKDLTKKLLILLALVSAQRLQTLAAISLPEIKKSSSGFEIKVSALLKTSRPGAPNPYFQFRFFEKPELCVANTLDHYLRVTHDIRGEEERLFLTVNKPHRAASKETLSRWIRQILSECGIDDSFGAHSTRHASTSTAWRNGASFDIIRSAAGWSQNSKVFLQFYNRPIQDNNYASFVLEK